MIIFINQFACSILLVWATWCCLSSKVNDGVLGKIIFGCIAITSLSVVLSPAYYGQAVPQVPGVILHICIAALGIRHMFIKYIWPVVLKKIRCLKCK